MTAPAQHGDARRSVGRRVYAELKHQIITSRLAPGQAMFEGQLAERMGVSKTPVREALGLLVQEGYVEVHPRQGYKVTEITLRDVQEMFMVRLLLEPAAAELAAERATAVELRDLQELSQASDTPRDPRDHERFVADDQAFHSRLATASGNRRLAAALQNLLDEMQRLLFLGLDLTDAEGEQPADHQALVDALLKGNHHLAHDIAIRQVETTRKRVTEGLLAGLDPEAAVDPTRPLTATEPVASGRADGSGGEPADPIRQPGPPESLTARPARQRTHTASAAARAYAEIKERILSCAIPPGSSISEWALALDLGLSKTPVREALAVLVHEGYVHIDARTGYQVSNISLTDVQELFYLRLLLEPAAASLAAEHASTDQLRSLRRIAESAADAVPFGERDRSFLFALAEASGNRRLAVRLKLLLEEIYRLHLAGFSFTAAHEDERQHRALVAALLKGNHHLAFDIATSRVESDRRRIFETILAATSRPTRPDELPATSP